jgi:hypothetical protein
MAQTGTGNNNKKYRRKAAIINITVNNKMASV